MQLIINEKPVTTEYAALIRLAYHSPDIAQYYEKKYGWNQRTMNTIDWDAMNHALKGVSIIRQTRILKLIHDWNLRTERTNFEKPRCDCGNFDSSLHRITCRFYCEDLEKGLRKINSKMKALRTHRPLREVLIQLLRGQEATPWGLRKGNLMRAIREQTQIGNKRI